MNSTSLTSAELTALHAETVNAAKAARTLTNISRRAAVLFTESGYKVYNCPGTSRYEVTSLKGDKYVVWHGVKVGYECNCPCFAEWNTCKHLEAIDLAKRDDAQAAEYDARDGYDPYAYRY